MLYNSDSPLWADIATLIVDAFTKNGITIRAVAMESKAASSKGKKHDSDMILGGKNDNPEPELFDQMWATKAWLSNSNNITGFGDSQTDMLIDSMDRAKTWEERFRLSHNMQRIIYDEQPMIVLYNVLQRNIIHKRWGNVTIERENPGVHPEQFRLIR